MPAEGPPPSPSSRVDGPHLIDSGRDRLQLYVIAAFTVTETKGPKSGRAAPKLHLLIRRSSSRVGCGLFAREFRSWRACRRRPRDGWHFSGDGVRFLQTGGRPRVWRTKSLISRLQAEARRRSLTNGAAVAERRVLGW